MGVGTDREEKDSRKKKARELTKSKEQLKSFVDCYNALSYRDLIMLSKKPSLISKDAPSR